MKTDIHPELNNVCFQDSVTGKQFLTRSTMKSDRVEKIDGEEYYVVVCSVTSDSHPAYTGERRLIDTAGRVEKFNTRFKNVTATKPAKRAKAGKNAKGKGKKK